MIFRVKNVTPSETPNVPDLRWAAGTAPWCKRGACVPAVWITTWLNVHYLYPMPGRCFSKKLCKPYPSPRLTVRLMVQKFQTTQHVMFHPVNSGIFTTNSRVPNPRPTTFFSGILKWSRWLFSTGIPRGSWEGVAARRGERSLRFPSNHGFPMVGFELWFLRGGFGYLAFLHVFTTWGENDPIWLEHIFVRWVEFSSTK